MTNTNPSDAPTSSPYAPAAAGGANGRTRLTHAATTPAAGVRAPATNALAVRIESTSSAPLQEAVSPRATGQHALPEQGRAEGDAEQQQAQSRLAVRETGEQPLQVEPPPTRLGPHCPDTGES